MEVNWDDPNLYEHLSLIITEYEKAALRSEKRKAIASVALGNTSGMRQTLTGSRKALEITRFETDTRESDTGVPELRIQGGVTFDEDLSSILGGGDLAQEIQSYMKECLNCDYRLNFRWQLQPIDLLGPISNIVRDINTTLDMFRERLNPMNTINQFCHFMNGMRFFCIPDLISMMLGLKMVLKNYLTASINLVVDWTAILGPLLQLILQGISSLVNQIAAVLTGPLDCAVAALRTLEELQRQTNMTIEYAGQVAGRVNDGLLNTEQIVRGALNGAPTLPGEAKINIRDIFYDGEPTLNVSHSSTGYQVTGQLFGNVSSADRPAGTDAPSDRENYVGSFATGLDFRNLKLPEMIMNKDFLKAAWTTKMVAVLQEARMLIRDLMLKVIGGLHSIQSLVSGGMQFRVGRLGLLLFIRDLLGMIMMAIRLLRERRNVTDWCEEISNEPTVLNALLNASGLDADNHVRRRDEIEFYIGPKLVGSVSTCLKVDSDAPEADLINFWVEKLSSGDYR